MRGKKKTADRVELLSAVEEKEIGKQQQLHFDILPTAKAGRF